MGNENKAMMDNLIKTLKDAREAINLAKSKKGSYVTVENLKTILADTLSNYKGSSLRKGEFDVNDLSCDETNNLDSYRFTMLQKSSNASMMELQKLNDDLLILGSVLSVVNKSSMRDSIMGSKLYQKFINHKAVSELRKAIDGTSGKGAEWIPTMFSADLMEKVKVELKVAALFGRIVMPSNPYTLPVEGSDAVGYLVSNTNSDDIRDSNAMPLASTPGTTKTTFDASKLGARTVFNEETNEDSIIGIMDYCKMKVVEAIARAIENATCNGSRTGTHPDNDIQVNGNSAKLSDRAWDGFRQCIQDASTWVDGATWNLAAFRSMRKKLGKYGIYATDLACVCSVNVMYKFMDATNFPEIQTLDKYGPNALILTGEIAKIDGIPIIVSEFMREDVAAAGFNTAGGPNTKSAVAIVNRKRFLYGDRREITTDSEKSIETDKVVVVSKVRQDFRRLQPNGESAIAGAYNVTP